MNLKQKTGVGYTKTKYSSMENWVKGCTGRADWTVSSLLRNGYAVMNGYSINEIIKVVRSLRELGVEYTMKTIESPTESVSNDKKWRDIYYEFTTVFFEDDRK